MMNDKDTPSSSTRDGSHVSGMPEVIQAGVTTEMCGDDSTRAVVGLVEKDQQLKEDEEEEEVEEEEEEKKLVSNFDNDEFHREEIQQQQQKQQQDIGYDGDHRPYKKESALDNNDNHDNVSMTSSSDFKDEHISIADTEEILEDAADNEEYPQEELEDFNANRLGAFCDEDLLSQSDDSEFKDQESVDGHIDDDDDEDDDDIEYDHDLVSEDNHDKDSEPNNNEFGEDTYNEHLQNDKDQGGNNHDHSSSGATFPEEIKSLQEEKENMDQDTTQNILHPPAPHLILTNMDPPILNKNEHETWFHHHLMNGFDHICKEWKLPSMTLNDSTTTSTTSTVHPSIFHQNEPNSIIINIIDPTTCPPGSVPTTPEHSPSRHMKRRAWNRDRIHKMPPKPKLRELNIFEKLDAALDRQCGKTLLSVRYRNLRTGEMESIDSLPMRMEMKARIVTDAAEWHTCPICHVYIAACCSVEHYREKVRPSLRAFVSQMEGVGSGNVSIVEDGGLVGKGGKRGVGGGESSGGGGGSSRDPQKTMAMAAANRAVAAAKDAMGGSSGSKYMIVFVPIHPSSVDGEGSKMGGAASHVDEAYKGGGIGLRGRIAAAAAARRINHGNNGSDARSTTNGGGNDDGMVSMADDGMTVSTSLSSSSSTTTATTTMTMLSKEHREIHKKFLADFPNGKTCLLSTLLDSDLNLVPENPVQKQELNSFCQELGKTIMMGFVDRIQRYNEELKRCEHEPGKAGSPTRKKRLEAIDWKSYFLIKESAAITFEQMRLPMEALYQYDEIEAKLPMNAFLEGERNSCPDAVRSIASTGCTEAFRGIVKSTKNMADIQHLISTYILGRQVQLLFLQKLPRAAINKCLAYVKKIYKLRCEQSLGLEINESQNIRLQNEIWATSACWDLKMASEAISSRLIELMKKKKSNVVHSPPASPERRAKAQRSSGMNEKALVRSICDVLNYARNRLLKICEIIFPPDALIRRAMEECPSDAFEEWQPLDFFNEMNVENVATEHLLPMISSDSWSNDCYNQNILKALESDKAFEGSYLEISHHLVQMNEVLERNRTVSRILAELAEIHILRGDLDAAADKLLTSIENFSLDPWDALLAWRVFRLACCQRKQQESKAPEYLKSLSCCLGSRLAKVIPDKFRHLLTLDLKTLVGRDKVSEYRWDLSPLFETEVSVKDTSGDKTTFSFNESNVMLHSCRVSDDVEFEVMLTSNLAEQIEVDELKLTLLTLEEYERVLNTNVEVTESQETIVLRSQNSIMINPGKNSFQFHWSTTSTNKFVVGSICLQWHKAAFYQDFTTPSNAVVGLEVLPTEPTQSIKLNPDYIIPGHIQDMNIHFKSGSDFVTSGTVKIFCSKGLQVMIPKDSENPILKEWQDFCQFSIGPCLPNSDITFIASVKSVPAQSPDPIIALPNDETEIALSRPSLKVEVTTLYQHGSHTLSSTDCTPIESPSFTTILEAKMNTLEYDIFAIKKCGFYPLNTEMFIISATVQCKMPIPFNITDWNISLPSTVILDMDGDLNVGICNQSFNEDDEICFGFRCKRAKSSTLASESNQVIRFAIILSDDIGRSFQHEMPINIPGLNEFLSLEESCPDEPITDIHLSLSSTKGLIGTPVTFSYEIDCNSLKEMISSSPSSSSARIHYQLSTLGTDWIVGGGNVKGTLSTSFEDSMTTRLSFLGIPTKVGILSNFPVVQLSILCQDESYNSNNSTQHNVKTLPVRQNDPSTFVSMNQTNVKAIAFRSV